MSFFDRVCRTYLHLIFKNINTCIRNPFDRWGHLVSNKETPAMHGYGIKSIERVVNAYGGMMYMYFEEKTSMFHTDILFYKPKKESAAGDISGLQDNG